MSKLQEFRTKYPAYDKVPDDQLVSKMHEKFYSHMPREEFDSAIGYAPAEPGLIEKGKNIVPRVLHPFSSPEGEETPKELWDKDKSVMDGYTPPQRQEKPVSADEYPMTAATPISQQSRDRFKTQWDVATPEQRGAMAQRKDWVGLLAQERGEVERKAAAAPTLEKKLVDTGRVEPDALGLDQEIAATPESATAKILAPKTLAGWMDERKAENRDYLKENKAAVLGYLSKVKGLEGEDAEFEYNKLVRHGVVPNREKIEKWRGEASYGDVLGVGAKRAYSGLARGYMGLGQWAGEAFGSDTMQDFFGNAAGMYEEDWKNVERNLKGRIPEDGLKALVAETAPSAIGQMPVLAAGAMAAGLTRNPALVQGMLSTAILTPIGAQTFGTAYLDGKKSGLSLGENTAYALGHAAAEVLPERLALGSLFKWLGGTKDGVRQWITTALKPFAAEIATEEVTTLTQFALDKMYTQPDLTLKDLQQQMIDTFKATALQTPVLMLTGAAGHAAGRGVRRAGRAMTGGGADSLSPAGVQPLPGVEVSAPPVAEDVTSPQAESSALAGAQPVSSAATQNAAPSEVGVPSGAAESEVLAQVASPAEAAGAAPTALDEQQATPGGQQAGASEMPVAAETSAIQPAPGVQPTDNIETVLVQREAEAFARDPVEGMVARAENAAIRRAGQPRQSATQVAGEIDTDALLAAVEALHTPSGNIIVTGENAEKAVKAVAPDAPILRRKDGAVMVSTRFSAPVAQAINQAKQRISVEFGDIQGFVKPQSAAQVTQAQQAVAQESGAVAAPADAGMDAVAPAGVGLDAAGSAEVQVRPVRPRKSKTMPAPPAAPVQSAGNAPSAGGGLDQALRMLLEHTDGNGSPDGLAGPQGMGARTRIVAALTGKSVAEVEADPRHKLATSTSQVEKLLHQAAGIQGENLRERRAAFLDFVDTRTGQAAPTGMVEVEDSGDGVADTYEDGETEAAQPAQPEVAPGAAKPSGKDTEAWPADRADVPSVFSRATRDADNRPSGGVDVSRVEADAARRDFLARFPGAPEIVLVDTFSQLPAEIQQQARNQGGDERGAKGVLHRGKAYAVVNNHDSMTDFEETLFHEAIGHAGVRALFGQDFVRRLNELYFGLGGQRGLVRIMKRRGMGDTMQDYLHGVLHAQRLDAEAFHKAVVAGDPAARRIWTDAMAQAVLTEEVFAHISEQAKDRPGVRDRFLELVGRIRQWLRDKGLMRLAALGESDLLHVLARARERMRVGHTGQGTDSGPAVFSAGRGEHADLSHAAMARTASNFSEAREAAKAFQGKPLRNQQSGIIAVVSRNSLDKMLSASAVSKSTSAADHALAVANLDQLFEHAQYGWSKPDRDSNTALAAIHRLFAPMDTANGTRLVKLTVKEYARAEQSGKLYTVETLEIGSPASIWVESAYSADGLGRMSTPYAGLIESLISSIQERNRGDSDAPGMLRRAEESPRSAVRTAAPPRETRFQKAQRKIQDKFNRFTVMKAWLKAQGINLSEEADVYKAEERMHARFANAAEDFREDIVKPLVEKTQKAGFTIGDVAKFLHAQHAQERNAQIAKINPAMPDGGSGMTDADAADILSKASPKLAEIANEFRLITESTKQVLLDAGIITPEIVGAWEKAYKHYVPLKGGPDTGIVSGTGKGLKARYTSKRALGHDVRNEGEWIIENILADHERALMLAEKNRVGQHLLKMAVEVGRDDLLSIGKPEKRGVLRENTTYEVIHNDQAIGAFQSFEAARAFRKTMAATLGGAGVESMSIRQTKDPTVAYMASPQLADNEVLVYVKGNAIRVQINDELLAHAYGNMGGEALNTIFRAGRSLNAFLSSVYTGYNPEFLLTNIVRDFQSGLVNLTGEQGLVMAARAVTNYPRAFRELLRYAMTRKASKTIEQYRADGGNTGAAYLPDLERLGEDIKKDFAAYQGVLANLKTGSWRGAARALGRKAFDRTLRYIEVLNMAGENAMRVAAYKAMVDSGRSRAAAASMAKNITVNFNRKGEWGSQINAAYLFFNASVQGTAAIAHAHLKGKHKYQAWGLSSGLAGLGYMMAAALGGGDEDEYDRLGDFVRSRNMVIKVGDGFLKIPIPYGNGFFWNIGRIIADMQRKGGELDKAAYHLATSFVEEFTPFGNTLAGDRFDGMQAFLYALPTVFQIIGAPLANRTAFGGPMMPVNEKDESQPDRDKMWRNTKGSLADDLAGAIDAATGLSISPETLKHLGRTFGGGAGSLVAATADAAWLKAHGADIDVKETPFVRRFYTKPDVRESRAAFWNAVKDVEEAANEARRALKAGDMTRYGDLKREKSELIMLERFAQKYRKAISARRDLVDRIRLSKDYTLSEQRMLIKQEEEKERKLYEAYLGIFKSQTTKMRDRKKAA